MNTLIGTTSASDVPSIGVEMEGKAPEADEQHQHRQEELVGAPFLRRAP